MQMMRINHILVAIGRIIKMIRPTTILLIGGFNLLGGGGTFIEGSPCMLNVFCALEIKKQSTKKFEVFLIYEKWKNFIVQCTLNTMLPIQLSAKITWSLEKCLDVINKNIRKESLIAILASTTSTTMYTWSYSIYTIYIHTNAYLVILLLARGLSAVTTRWRGKLKI